MPLTRALSVRLLRTNQNQGSALQQPQQQENGNADDILALKARNHQATPRRPTASRNASSPCILQSSSISPNVKSTSSSSTRSSNSCSSKSSVGSSWSSSSRRRSVLGSSEFGESSDEDGENPKPTSARRHGGCCTSFTTANRPDDYNKENVAPLRFASEDVLQQEARYAQEENAVRRTTRSRRSSLMERTGFSGSSLSSPISSVRRMSRSSTSGDLPTIITTPSLTAPCTPSRRLQRTGSDNMVSSSPSSSSSSRFAVMPSTPTRSTSLTASGRKRSSKDAGLDLDCHDISLPSTPISKLRLQTPTSYRSEKRSFHLAPSASSSAFSSSSSSYTSAASAYEEEDEMDSYFASSQESMQSSLFDTVSVAESSSTAASSSRSSSVREISPPSPCAKAVAGETYSSVYAHARALLRYAAGVDPAETESGLTITSNSATQQHVKVVGRTSERLAIELFLQNRFGLFPSAPASASSSSIELDGDAESACLYVCGLPGTGKTALVRSVLNSLSSTSSEPPRVAFVNCMTLSHPRLVFGKVLQALGSNAAEGQTDSVAEAALSSLIKDGRERILIVLDEMDHLLHSRAHQNILYRLFSWAATGASCSLIGIANSLDLTERFVPLLASKGASPALLHFRPFEAREIVSVIQDRLGGLQSRYDTDVNGDVKPEAEESKVELPLFTPTALELLAKKIAGATGDLRKALDAARLAVEMVENEQRKKALADAVKQEEAEASKSGTEVEAEVETDPSCTPAKTVANKIERSKLLSHLTPSTAVKVVPAQILRVLTAVLGSPNLSKIRNLGVQPKLILLSMLVAQVRSEHDLGVLGGGGGSKLGMLTGSGSVSVAKGQRLRIADVESTYTALLKQDGQFSPLETSELLGVFDMLEVNGVIRISSEVESGNGGSSRSGDVTTSSVVSPSGKRSAKKQLLASNRTISLAMSQEDVVKGITTSGPASHPGSIVMSNNNLANNSSGTSAVVETIAKIYVRETERAVKAKTYHSIAQENRRIRDEELGGGRMGVAVGNL